MKILKWLIILVIIIAGIWFFVARPTDEVKTDDINTGEELTQLPDVEVYEDLPIDEESIISPYLPKSVEEGSFVSLDLSIRGSGIAKVYYFGSGSPLLRLENFRVTNAPDLKIFLSATPDLENINDLSKVIEIDNLKGNVGDQNYHIPKTYLEEMNKISPFSSRNFDFGMYPYVIIYSESQDTIYAKAELK